MFAIVQTGGKQYRVEPGKLVRVDRIQGEVGDEIELENVLLANDAENTQIGQPFVSGAKVTAKIVRQDKYKKIVVFRYARRKNSSRKIGHRQQYTELNITGISL